MRSSEARSRNPLSDAGRRTSKTLKLRLAKQLPPLCPPTAGEAPDQTQHSLLYNQQLWAAAGQQQQSLTCDRHLYYPELAVAAPVVKQLPVDSAIDVHLGKRAKLAGGQYRRSFRDAGTTCDSTPPSTPYRSNRQQSQFVIEDRPHSSACATTSSSSSHELSVPRQSSSAEKEADNVAWPIVVSTRQKRSSRTRRTQWQRWPPALQDLAAAPDNFIAAIITQQQDLLECSLQQQLHQPQLFAPPPVPQQESVAAWQQQLVQQPSQSAAAGALVPSAAIPLQQAAVQGIAAVFPATCSTICAKAAAAVKAAAVKAAAVGDGGDISPGHETSQSSDMTTCRDSPRCAAGVALSSWPSSSTESDCPAQMQQSVGIHKAAAGKRPLLGTSVSPESPSSPVHEVF